MKWSDIVLINKPAGITSFDVIRALRKVYTNEYDEKAPKMGHAGTLDPAATGLMIIGMGEGTKQLKDCIGLDKEYSAEILLGEKRSTGDMDGEVLEEVLVPEISHDVIAGHLERMQGTLRLPVSAYSAMKKGGVPMYKRAREAQKIGELVKVVPWRDMEVFEAVLITPDATTTTAVNRGSCGGENVSKTGKVIVSVKFRVGSGTYIRSLAEELGSRLGYPATLYSLKRTKVGDFSLADAQNLPTIHS